MRRRPASCFVPIIAALLAMLCVSDTCGAVNLNPDGVTGRARKRHACQDLTGGLVQPVLDDGACAGYIEPHGASGDAVTVSFGTDISGSLLAFDGGRTVVVLQNELFGTMTADGVFASGDGDAEHDPILVLVYRDGKRTGAYRWTEVLKRPRMVYTDTFCGDWVSDCPERVVWLQTYRVTDSAPRELVLKTNSLREFALNLTAGVLSAARDAPEWSACDIIAQGPTARHDAHGQMGAVQLLKGELPPALDFTIAPDVPIFGEGDNDVVCLNRSPTGLVATSRLPIAVQRFTGDVLPVPAEVVGKAQAHPPQIQIGLRSTEFFAGMIGGQSGTTDIWHLRLRADRPIQSIVIGLVGSAEAQRRANFDRNDDDYHADLYDIPPDAQITLRVVDGHGVELTPTIQRFDTLAAARALPAHWKQHLESSQTLGFKITDGRNGPYLSGRDLRDARCAMRELHYGVNHRTMDHRDVFPACRTENMKSYLDDTYNAMMQNDVFLSHDLPSDVAYVTAQLVYFDGSVSKTATIQRPASPRAGAKGVR